jgi:hypothetical protein
VSGAVGYRSQLTASRSEIAILAAAGRRLPPTVLRVTIVVVGVFGIVQLSR